MVVGAAVATAMSGMASALLEDEVQAESAAQVVEDVSVSEEDLSGIQEAAEAAGVPWQVLVALREVGNPSGGRPSGVAEVIVPDGMTCPDSGLAAESGLTSNALLALRCAAHAFPEVTAWGGVGERTNNPNSDHPAGRAVDAMIPGWDTPEGNQLGWEVAEWFVANAQSLGIRYVIWDSQIWNGGDSWGPYTHPSGGSNPTLDHRDHVHVSVVPDGQSAPSPSAGGVGAGGGSGLGPYNLTEDAGLSAAQAETDSIANPHVAQLLAERLDTHAGTYGTDLGAGSHIRDDGTRVVAVSEGAGEGDIVNADGAEAAEGVRATYVAALSELPIAGMNEGRAEAVFEAARAWYLGQSVDDLGGGGGGMCLVGESGALESLTTTGPNGVSMTLNAVQVTNASIIIGAGQEMDVPERGLIIALMTALQESTLRNLANDGSDMRLSAHDREVVRESLNFPNDGIGSDWDSVNPFQQRPSMGWGTVEELMDPHYAATTFFERLTAIDDWQSLGLGEAAQRVQISAFPDAYDKWQGVAEFLVDNVTGASCSSPEFSAEGWTHPVPGAPITSAYNLTRRHPVFGHVQPHRGTDFGAPPGTPIHAVQGGTVIKTGGKAACTTGGAADSDPDYWITGFFVAIDHGGNVTSTYNHLRSDIPVTVGQEVEAGDVIGYVSPQPGSGCATGPHLHFQILTGKHGFTDPEPFMAGVGVNLRG